MTNSPRWESVVRRAARELAPVQVRREGGAERRTTFLSGCVSDSGDEWVRLRPWAGGPVGRCVVDAPAEGWRLRCTDARLGGDELLVPLGRARFETRERALGLETDSLVLLCPTGVDDLHVLPVVELEGNGCTVESTVGLAVGHTFAHVELHGDRGPLRVASAVVVAAEAWVDALGNPFLRHRLRFDLPLASSAAPPEYDVLADPERIDRVLTLASLLQSDLSSSEEGRRVLVACESDRLVMTGPSWNRIGPVEIAFDLFALRYEATVRVLGGNRTTRPLLLRRRRRRSESRVDTRHRDLFIRFTHPVRRDSRRSTLIDLSARGLCFSAEEEPLLWPGLVLEDARVENADLKIRLGDLEIRSVTESLAHARLLSRDPVSSELGDLLASLRHPDLEAHDGASFDSQLDLYRACGLVMPFMSDLLDAQRVAARDAWRRAHTSASSLCRTFARYEQGEAVASVSALQAWEQTWLGQHLAARPGRTGCTPGELLMAFLDFVVLRPDCHQMVFFASASNERMNGIQRRFQELTGTAEAATRIELRGWSLGSKRGSSRDAATLSRTKGRRVRVPNRSDRRVIERAVRRDWGGLAARALSLDAEALFLPDLARAYRRMGLKRGREVLVACEAGLPRWAAVTERGSPGLSIPGLLHATWLLPLHDGGSNEHLLTALVQGLDLDEREPRRLVLAARGLPSEPFEMAGLDSLVDVNVYVLNRAGLRRYASYLLESYGERGAELSSVGRGS